MNHWEKFANEDAEYYIFSDKEVNFTTEEGQQHFYRTGREFVELMLARVQPLLSSKTSALEIGSGIGRLTMPHAKVFGSVTAVDISPTMLTKLKANATAHGLSNINGFLYHEDWDKGSKYDYVYSFIVFQHIQDYNIIKDYISRIAACLKDDGIIQIQFDTRPASFMYKLRNLMPDLILPKDQKKGIRRIRRTSKELNELFKANNLETIKEFDTDDENHTFILKKKK